MHILLNKPNLSEHQCLSAAVDEHHTHVRVLSLTLPPCIPVAVDSREEWQLPPSPYDCLLAQQVWWRGLRLLNSDSVKDEGAVGTL